MRRLTLTALIFFAAPALAGPLPPGIVSAQLVPGWVQDDGRHMAGFAIQLEPGWKTYWRNPGDAGVPPVFDWSGSENLADVTIHWPRPEVFDTDGLRTIGYHDGVVLPLEITPTRPDAPVHARASVELGVCRDICVPVRLTLSADLATDPSKPEPVRAALGDVPRPSGPLSDCTTVGIGDGLTLRATLPMTPPPDTVAVVESTMPGIWTSPAALEGNWVTADLVPPEARPFPLDPASVRVTLLFADHAEELTGCPAP